VLLLLLHAAAAAETEHPRPRHIVCVSSPLPLPLRRVCSSTPVVVAMCVTIEEAPGHLHRVARTRRDATLEMGKDKNDIQKKNNTTRCVPQRHGLLRRPKHLHRVWLFTPKETPSLT